MVEIFEKPETGRKGTSFVVVWVDIVVVVAVCVGIAVLVAVWVGIAVLVVVWVGIAVLVVVWVGIAVLVVVWVGIEALVVVVDCCLAVVCVEIAVGHPLVVVVVVDWCLVVVGSLLVVVAEIVHRKLAACDWLELVVLVAKDHLYRLANRALA
jgi:hypothetical protein